MPRIIQVSVPSLRVTLSSIFRKQGFNSTDALYLAGTLIDADQRGISSHGTRRCGQHAHVSGRNHLPPYPPLLIPTACTHRVELLCVGAHGMVPAVATAS